ncbi:MAG TPA: ATP-dependent helicase [Clostridia bacterium]|nr:ATP-dependent helicase [Clostridia bacterium]
MKIIEGLNDAQLQAVTSKSKYILCLAGAGTGKTKTLTTRIEYLNQDRISCDNMLALTFTRAAGKEMKERIIQLVGEDEGKKLFCNTFHAFCVKVLKEYGGYLGYDPDFTIYDQEDRDSILQSIITEFRYKINLKKVLKLMESDGELSLTQKEYSEANNVIKEYWYQLKKNNAIDLDMLLTEALYIIKGHRPTYEDYHNRYEYMFVDEFQDTNDVQMEIIKALAPKNLFVVGDDFQAIYGWRGARIDYILNFDKEYPGCEVIKLEENYRSTRPIVDAANALIKHNIHQTEKVLLTNRPGDKISFEHYPTEAGEIGGVCRDIAGETSNFPEVYMYKDYAILARTNKQLAAMAEGLKYHNIPYHLISGNEDPFKVQDVKLLLNMIELALNPKDDALFKKVVNFPVKRISESEFDRLEKLAIEEELHFMEIPHSFELMAFRDELRGALENCDDAGSTFSNFVSTFEIHELYEQQGRYEKRDDFINARAEIAKWQRTQEDLGEDKSIQAFLKWLHIKDIQDKLIEDRDAVKLMTVHASKGLEFKNVFIIGMNDGVFPSNRTTDMEEERRLFYVAVTRAKEQLHITRAKEIAPPWGYKSQKTLPSKFIGELYVKPDTDEPEIDNLPF